MCWDPARLVTFCDPGVMALCLEAEKSWLPRADGRGLPCRLEGCQWVSPERRETQAWIGGQ